MYNVLTWVCVVWFWEKYETSGFLMLVVCGKGKSKRHPKSAQDFHGFLQDGILGNYSM
jgi:hypothetical protein